MAGNAQAEAPVSTRRQGVGTRPSALTRTRVRSAWLFLAPMLLTLAAVAGWPLLRTFYFSFTDAYLADLTQYQFIGLDNFAYLVKDPIWWGAVRNTFVFAIASVTLELILGMAIAMVLNAHLPGRGLLLLAIRSTTTWPSA